MHTSSSPASSRAGPSQAQTQAGGSISAPASAHSVSSRGGGGVGGGVDESQPQSRARRGSAVELPGAPRRHGKRQRNLTSGATPQMRNLSLGKSRQSSPSADVASRPEDSGAGPALGGDRRGSTPADADSPAVSPRTRIENRRPSEAQGTTRAGPLEREQAAADNDNTNNTASPGARPQPQPSFGQGSALFGPTPVEPANSPPQRRNAVDETTAIAGSGGGGGTATSPGVGRPQPSFTAQAPPFHPSSPFLFGQQPQQQNQQQQAPFRPLSSVFPPQTQQHHQQRSQLQPQPQPQLPLPSSSLWSPRPWPPPPPPPPQPLGLGPGGYEAADSSSTAFPFGYGYAHGLDGEVSHEPEQQQQQHRRRRPPGAPQQQQHSHPRPRTRVREREQEPQSLQTPHSSRRRGAAAARAQDATTTAAADVAGGDIDVMIPPSAVGRPQALFSSQPPVGAGHGFPSSSSPSAFAPPSSSSLLPGYASSAPYQYQQYQQYQYHHGFGGDGQDGLSYASPSSHAYAPPTAAGAGVRAGATGDAAAAYAAFEAVSRRYWDDPSPANERAYDAALETLRRFT
ncbi:hypothetical protein GGR56DRAFT_242824 [Xylariaceae sp. FL0804]|nr:hypothetical protein GGR56DRAFT_242824 [Xylariaceae sp. FL0804]